MEDALEIPIINDLTMVLGSISQVPFSIFVYVYQIYVC